MQLKQIGALAALALMSTLGLNQASAQDSVESGYSRAALPYPGSSSTRTLTNGDIVTFNGSSIDLYDANGVLVNNLGGFASPVFGGCLAIAPDETYVIVGETSTNDIFKVAIDGSGMTLLTNMVFNSDATFAPNGDLYISAATCGFCSINEIIQVDVITGAQRKIADLAGPSGPITFDALGNLYYATIDPVFPSPAGSTDVLIFLAADVAAADCNTGTCLTEVDAIPYAQGYDGASALEYDVTTGYVYMLENNFGSGVNRIWRLTGGAPNFSDILVEGTTSNWMGNLEFFTTGSAATFAPYQPNTGAVLNYSSTDFGSFSARSSVKPKRASIAITGPGATGAGAGAVEVTDGVPGGAAIFFFGPTALKSPSESAYSLAGIALPIFSDLNLASLTLLPGMIMSDGLGDSSYAFTNPGGLNGLFSVQALLIDSGLVIVRGATPSVDL
ncbi:MAG: hypothetical protein ACI8Q9_000157 [Planctomycetota bacterium]|jgi:hypothetical protein